MNKALNNEKYARAMMPLCIEESRRAALAGATCGVIVLDRSEFGAKFVSFETVLKWPESDLAREAASWCVEMSPAHPEMGVVVVVLDEDGAGVYCMMPPLRLWPRGSMVQ